MTVAANKVWYTWCCVVHMCCELLMLQSGIWHTAIVHVGTSWFSKRGQEDHAFIKADMHVFMWLPT